MKVKSVVIFMTVSIPIEIGGLKANVDVQLSGVEGSIPDVEWTDITDLEFHGIPVKSYNKVKEFFNSMGINIGIQIQKQVDMILTEDVVLGALNSVIVKNWGVKK